MLMKLYQKGLWLRAKVSNRRGQNTVEYLLMLSVVVGVVLVAGVALKNMMPGLFEKVRSMIDSATTQAGSGGG